MTMVFSIRGICDGKRTDKIESLSYVAAEVGDDEIGLSFLAAKGAVQTLGPNLGILGKGKKEKKRKSAKDKKSKAKNVPRSIQRSYLRFGKTCSED